MTLVSEVTSSMVPHGPDPEELFAGKHLSRRGDQTRTFRVLGRIK